MWFDMDDDFAVTSRDYRVTNAGPVLNHWHNAPKPLPLARAEYLGCVIELVRSACAGSDAFRLRISAM
jgi:hypothetical protein